MTVHHQFCTVFHDFPVPPSIAALDGSLEPAFYIFPFSRKHLTIIYFCEQVLIIKTQIFYIFVKSSFCTY